MDLKLDYLYIKHSGIFIKKIIKAWKNYIPTLIFV